MSDLILYIVKQLVSNPDGVSVEEKHDGGEVNLILTVDPVDMGLIIGKNGQTIKAIRKVLIVKAMADNVRVNLQLAEPEGGRPERSESQQVSEPAASVSQLTSEPENTDTPTSADNAESLVTDTPTPADTADTPEETVVKKSKKAKKLEVSVEAEKVVEKHVDEIAEQD